MTLSTFIPYDLSHFGRFASHSAAQCQGGQHAPAPAQARTECLCFPHFYIMVPQVVLNRLATVDLFCRHSSAHSLMCFYCLFSCLHSKAAVFDSSKQHACCRAWQSPCWLQSNAIPHSTSDGWHQASPCAWRPQAHENMRVPHACCSQPAGLAGAHDTKSSLHFHRVAHGMGVTCHRADLGSSPQI